MFTPALCWPSRRNTVDAHTPLCKPCPRSQAPFYSLSQSFILIAGWTVCYQHVNDPLVSQVAVLPSQKYKRVNGFSRNRKWSGKTMDLQKWIISSKGDLDYLGGKNNSFLPLWSLWRSQSCWWKYCRSHSRVGLKTETQVTHPRKNISSISVLDQVSPHQKIMTMSQSQPQR